MIVYCLSFSLSFSFCLCLSLSLCFSVSVCLFLRLYRSVSVFVSLPLFFCLSCSFSVFVSTAFSFCLSLFVAFSLLRHHDICPHSKIPHINVSLSFLILTVEIYVINITLYSSITKYNKSTLN